MKFRYPLFIPLVCISLERGRTDLPDTLRFSISTSQPQQQHHDMTRRNRFHATPLSTSENMNSTQRRLLAILAAVLMLAMPVEIEGFAPVMRAQIIPKMLTHVSHYDRKITLKSSAASSMEISSTIESQGDLSAVQSLAVKALMIAYIASMCVALPV